MIQQNSSSPKEPIRSMREYELRYFPKQAEEDDRMSQPPEQRGRELAKSLLDDLRLRLQGTDSRS